MLVQARRAAVRATTRHRVVAPQRVEVVAIATSAARHRLTEAVCRVPLQTLRGVTHHRTSVLQVVRRVVHRVRQALHRISVRLEVRHRVVEHHHVAKGVIYNNV